MLRVEGTFTLYIMVLTLDGNSEHVAHVGCKTGFVLFFLKFAVNVDPNECLKQIKVPITLNACAPISELPSNVRYTMDLVEFYGA